MRNNKGVSICIFLILSITAHFISVYLAFKPIAATQNTLTEAVDSIQEINIISEAGHSNNLMPSPRVKKTGEVNSLKSRKDSSFDVAPLDAKVFDRSAADLPENETFSLSVIDDNVNDIVMLPLMQARELLISGLNLLDFNDAERLHPFSLNPLYFDAADLDKRAKARKNLVPLYPHDAYAANRQGRVIAELLIDSEGNLDSSLILAATEGFEDSATQALRGMTFFPAEIEGRQVASRLLIEMDYLMVNPSFSKVDREDIVSVDEFDKQDK